MAVDSRYIASAQTAQKTPLPTALLLRMSSSGMWRCVDLVSTDVSEECIASIFRVEKSASGVPA
jgi:hypothetical protein